MKHRSKVIVLAPLVAVATLMIGMRVGAGSGFRAALVYGAHPGHQESPAFPQRYAFQMITYYEDRGIREAVAMKDLTVEMRDVDGHDAHWTGESNEDGVAEITFEMPGSPVGLAFDARQAGEREPLAFGIIDLTKAPPKVADWSTKNDRLLASRIRPSKREGELGMEVYVESGRLAVGSPHDVWVRVEKSLAADGGASDGGPSDAGVPTVHATPEVGVAFLADDAPADCFGYAKMSATALGQAASTQLEAKGAHGEKGVWFGTLPTAPGAFDLRVPSVFVTDDVKPAAREAIVIAPNPRKIAYVEIDDNDGRVWAAALPLAVEAGDPLPRARVPLGHLSDGVYWLVVSGDPRGAENMMGATIAKQFTVTSREACGDCTNSCNLGLTSAQDLAGPTRRYLALDGIATRGAKNRASKRLGLLIGLVALGAAALLEALLLTQASREARHALEAAEAESEGATRAADLAPAKTGNLIVALLVALLGFAFLAALMIAKA